MDKLEYLAKTLSRTRRKDYENYVVNAVWNRIGDSNLKPVSQQWLAGPDGKGYFIDLYFPQVNIGVECDEAYHKGVSEKDRTRELDLIDILDEIDAEHGYRALHVDITQGYETVEEQIDAAAGEIRAEAGRRRATGTFEPWNPEASPEQLLTGAQAITTGSRVSFRTIRETCNVLFGTGYESDLRFGYFTPRGRFREEYGGSYKVWFPGKATADGRGNSGWVNVVSADGKTILERRETPGRYVGEKDTNIDRITFIKARDPITGETAYHFLGVFRPMGTCVVDGRKCHRYERVATSFPILP